MAEEQKTRIINLAEKTAPDSGDFFAVDSQAGGSKKIPTTALAKAADLTAEASARTQADNALTGAINSASALIQNPTKTLSGALCSFTDGADMPMVACTAEIVPKQSGTGTPSPENVRPISGWESVTVADYAVNMLTEQTNEIQPCFIRAGEQVTASVKKVSGDGNCTFRYYRADGTQIDYWTLSNEQDGRFARAVTIAEDTYFVKFDVSSSLVVDERQVASRSKADSWLYNPTLAHVATTDLGRTVYGGTLDVVSGVLTVDRAMDTFDGNSTFAIQGSGSDYVQFRTTATNPIMIKSPYGSWVTNDDNFKCNALALSSSNPANSIRPANAVNPTTVYITMPLSIDTVDKVKEFATQTPIQYVYPLATPQTYSLTPTEVNTLLGENNVWADSGDVEITYRRDISIVLENLENAING